MPNDDVFDFQCPKCGKRLKAGVAFAGRRVKCPKCQQPVTVPGVRDSSPAPSLAAKRLVAKPPQSPVAASRTIAGGPAAGVASTGKPASPSPIPAPAAETPSYSKPDTPVAAASSTLASVPVASLDDDWLNLGQPAIADLSARQQAVEENKSAKERERASKKNKEQQRRQSNPKVTAESLETASQRRLADQPSVASSAANMEHLNDDLPGLAPLIAAGHSRVSPLNSTAAENETSAKRSVFDDDLPELAELQPSGKPKSNTDKLLATHAGVDFAELDDLAALVPDLGTAPVRGGKSASRSSAGAAGQAGLPALFNEEAQQGQEVEDKDPEYRIECRACGTAQYVRLSSTGKKIKCPDCYVEFKIPPPPAGWSSKKKAKLELTGEDIPLSAAGDLHHAQTQAAQRTRTAQMLEKAKQQVSDEDLDRLYDGDFDTAGFMQRTFGFFKDPVAIAHVVGYGMVFAALFAAGQFAANNLESNMGRGMLLLTVIGAPVIGILFAMPMLSGGIALLESVANRQKQVADWPGFNLFDNAGDIAAISVALLGALIPGFLVGSWLGGEGEGAGRIQIAGMMVTTFALFPVFLLSMLDNGSVFAPLSNSIFRSFSQAAEAWGAYYLKTLVAFATVMLLWLLLLGKHEGLAAAAGCLLPLLVFFTCQQIGALADAISEHLSFEWVPPDKDADDGDADSEIVNKENSSGRNRQAMQP